MTPETIKTLSTEELIKKRNQLQAVSWVLIVAFSAGFIATVYLSIRESKIEYSGLIAVALIPSFIQNLKNVRLMKAEIESRK